MARYVLDHGRGGESSRLTLMSRLLDPFHRRLIESIGVERGTRTLEVGCGNGSMSAWLAELVAPGGHAVAVDIDLSLAAGRPGLELRRHDILSGPVEPRDFDLVTARAVLHHLPDPGAAIANMLASLRPGGAVLLIEPDFLPVGVAEPREVRAFWAGWLAWARDRGIDYGVGRSLAPRLAALGMEEIGGSAETAIYNGGSPWADYWRRTVDELREDLLGFGEAERRPGRGLPRTMRRSHLVDADDRVHRRPGAPAEVMRRPGGRLSAHQLHPLRTAGSGASPERVIRGTCPDRAPPHPLGVMRRAGRRRCRDERARPLRGFVGAGRSIRPMCAWTPVADGS